MAIAGFRWHKDEVGSGVGSLILGLHDDAGTLHHVGVASGFAAARRRELVDELAPLRAGALDGHPWREWATAQLAEEAYGRRMPGAQSRWNRGKDLTWEPLRVERVAEVAYDHLQGDRFRHATRLVRWRPDRRPDDCRYDQLETTAAVRAGRHLRRPTAMTAGWWTAPGASRAARAGSAGWRSWRGWPALFAASATAGWAFADPAAFGAGARRGRAPRANGGRARGRRRPGRAEAAAAAASPGEGDGGFPDPARHGSPDARPRPRARGPCRPSGRVAPVPDVPAATAARLDRALARAQKALLLPGVEATVIFADGSTWTGAAGMADVAAGRPVEPGRRPSPPPASRRPSPPPSSCATWTRGSSSSTTRSRAGCRSGRTRGRSRSGCS